MLKSKNYVATVKELDGTTKHVYYSDDELNCWDEELIVRKYYKNPDAKFYYTSGTNDIPAFGYGFIQEPQCKCTKRLGGLLEITIKEKKSD